MTGVLIGAGAREGDAGRISGENRRDRSDTSTSQGTPGLPELQEAGNVFF